MQRLITSLEHPLVKHFVKLRQNRDYREEHHSLVIEGIKLVTEMGQEAQFKTLVAWDETLLPKEAKADEVLIVSEAVMKKISGMQTPEGLLAEIAMPQPASLAGLHRIIVLDGVSDPGNVGTLLRSALALGWQGVYFLENSCDPFNEKALRSALGATFRLSLAWGNWLQLKQLIKDNQLEPIVAEVDGCSLKEVSANERLLLVLGNEAHGASGQAKKICRHVAIPMSGKMESLNVAVAGGIIMYELGGIYASSESMQK